MPCKCRGETFNIANAFNVRVWGRFFKGEVRAYMTLLELLALLRKHLKLVVALPIVCGLAMAVFSFLFMPNTYTATSTLYVLANSSAESTSSLSTDLSASQMITNDVSELIQSDRIEREAASSLSMTNLDGYSISVDSQTTTRVITLSVTGKSADNVATVANALAKATDKVAQDTMGLESVNVIDEAQKPTSPSGPNRGLYTAVAFLAGLFVAIAIVVLLDMLNTRVRKPEDAEELLGIPVIGRIPVIKA